MGGKSSKRAPVYDIEGVAAKSAPNVSNETFNETYDETTMDQEPTKSYEEIKQQVIDMRNELVNKALKAKHDKLLLDLRDNILRNQYSADRLGAYIRLYQDNKSIAAMLGFDVKLMEQLVSICVVENSPCSCYNSTHKRPFIISAARFSCWINRAIIDDKYETLAFFLPAICSFNHENVMFINSGESGLVKKALAYNNIDIVTLLIKHYNETNIDFATEAAPFLDRALMTKDIGHLNKVKQLIHMIKIKPFKG